MIKIIKKLLYAFILIIFAASCKNEDVDFPDYTISAVYFPYQYPVRTIVLGNDPIVDNSLDNQNSVKVYATLSGLYKNKNRVIVNISVDDNLCNNLYFEDGISNVKPLPKDYYELESDNIIMNKTLSDGVVVKLTDKFFNDPLSITTNYVLPLCITSVENADSVLCGQSSLDSPIKTKSEDWMTQPKDFVLYSIKYINPYHSYYLRRGEDKITKNGLTNTVIRKEQYVEKDQVIQLPTTSINSNVMSITIDGSADENKDLKSCNLILTFDDKGSCVVSTNDPDFSVSGMGQYVTNGEKKSWGNKDRDALYLKYSLNYKDLVKYETTDTLVMRDRGVKIEEFSPVYKN